VAGGKKKKERREVVGQATQNERLNPTKQT